MKTQLINIYQYDELSDTAKSKARDWFRNSGDFDYQFVYEDADCLAAMLGITIDRVAVQLMNKTVRYDPAIYWSGFSSQGDGACFTGSYKYKKGAAKTTVGHAPIDSEIARIARALQEIQRKHFYKLAARITHRDRYYHARTMDIEVFHIDDEYRDTGEAKQEIKELLIDFADWIYKQLEAEYHYQNSDEAVEENILANEYEFLETGETV